VAGWSRGEEHFARIFSDVSEIAAMSYLSDLLRVDQINLDLRAPDKPGVLQELVEMVPELKGDSGQKEIFFKALLDREKLHTTGVGEGIAMPHTRLPVGGFLKRPLLIFGRSVAGLEFGALDQKPVHLLFLLASPNLTDHLAMLARLSRVLRDPKVRKGLSDARMPSEIISLIDEGESRVTK